MDFIHPLDFETLFVNILGGSDTILLFIVMLFIGALAGRFRIPNVVVLIMLAMFSIVMNAYFVQFYSVIILLIGFIVPYTIMRMLNR